MPKERRIVTVAAAFILLIAVAALGGCLGGTDDDGGDEEQWTLTINGVVFTVDGLFDTHPEATAAVNGVTYRGVRLSDLINATGLHDPASRQYHIAAADGYAKDVTWADMTRGVLVREDVMTAFPGLPGKYRIQDVISIEPVDVPTISVLGTLFTWRQPFDILGSVSVEAGNGTYSGVPLGGLVNLTGPADPGSGDYRIVNASGANATVNWTALSVGVLVDEGRMAVIPALDPALWPVEVVAIESTGAS